MRVLITGGMGVIGAEASRKFVREGHRPVIFARHRDESLIRDILDKVDIELGSILDRARLVDVIKSRGITHLVHTAAYISALSAAHPAESVEINVMGTVNVLEAARATNAKRVVYTSAKGVYGPFRGDYGSPTYKLVSEDHPKEPKRIYDSAKLMGENATLYWGTLGLDVIVLRFATTYGPGKTARHGNMGVTSQIVENPANGLPFRIAQGGDEKDDFIYNKDSALGIYLATTAKNPQNRVFNIGTGVGVTLQDFAAVLRRHLSNAVIEIGPGLNFLGSPYPMAGVYDISRAQKELGYKPAFDLEFGIADYLESLARLKLQAA
jgi:UDP-glucose 4-epimerase